MKKGKKTRNMTVLIKTEEDVDFIKKREQLKRYMMDMETKLESQIQDLEKMAENMTQMMHNVMKGQLLSLSEHVRKMKIADYEACANSIQQEEKKNTGIHSNGISENLTVLETFDVSSEKTSAFPLRSVRQSARLKKKSQSIVQNQINQTGKKRLRNIVTPRNTQMTPSLFTPKFDPRLPLTPATGFRSIKPGEKFIMMSMAGSPLGNVDVAAPATTLVTLEDGKSISMTDDQLDEETRKKLRTAQEMLMSLHSASKS